MAAGPRAILDGMPHVDVAALAFSVRTPAGVEQLAVVERSHGVGYYEGET